ncbi:hypothetical protein [Roseovarius aestuarii]|uniref:Uncharacterized protein n=1 Tax=Roseovarius aestuarii TaxID=475083 RepID=A0A1X7BXP8_9RHOB|nr:hypothetical protein [Roseovarius aestuarii]SMC14371.1 hypothetical protein ROA7745_04238 [Roseovarius aestuarii]
MKATASQAHQKNATPTHAAHDPASQAAPKVDALGVAIKRPEMVIQRKLQALADQSAQVKQLRSHRLAAAGAVLQRVRLIGPTGGVDYDRSKLDSLKVEEMKKWQGLPGFEDSSDYTWHHIAPQSRLTDRGLASNRLLVRLGPSASARIGDPGNDFTDPNFDETGTRTPFSEGVEGAVGKDTAIDPGELTRRLQGLAREREGKASQKSYSNPSTWHIPLEVLVQFIDECPDSTADGPQKELMRKTAHKNATLVAYNDYKDKSSPERQELAVPLITLHEDQIGADLKGLFHAAIHKRPSFVRGHVLDEFQNEKFKARTELIVAKKRKFEQLINTDGELLALAKQAGPDLVRKKGVLQRYNQMTKAMQVLVTAPGTGVTTGLKHKFYPGNRIRVDHNLWLRAMEYVVAFREKNDTDNKIKNLPVFGLEPHADVTRVIPLLGVAKQALGKEETRALDESIPIDKEREAAILGTLPDYKPKTELPRTKTAYSKRKTPKRNAARYPITDEEAARHKQLVMVGKQEEADELRKTLHGRGMVAPEAFKLSEAKRIAEGEREKKVSAEMSEREGRLQDEANREKLEEFRNTQDERTRKLNTATRAFIMAYEDETEVSFDLLFDFLMRLWPDMRTQMDAVVRSMRWEIRPEKEPADRKDLETYESDLSQKYDDRLKTGVKDIRSAFHDYAK